MNFAPFAPYIGSIIRHLLVTGGLFEASRADDVSNQLAGALVAIIGAIWSQYNAHKSKVAKEPNAQ